MEFLWILIPVGVACGILLGRSLRTARQERYIAELVRGLSSVDPKQRQVARSMAAFHGGVTAFDLRSVFTCSEVLPGALIELSEFSLGRYPGVELWVYDAMLRVLQNAPNVADRLNALRIMKKGIRDCDGFVKSLGAVLELDPDPVARDLICDVLWDLYDYSPPLGAEVACALVGRLADPCDWISDKVGVLLREMDPSLLVAAELRLMVLVRNPKPSVRNSTAHLILDRENVLRSAKTVVLGCLRHLDSDVRARV